MKKIENITWRGSFESSLKYELAYINSSLKTILKTTTDRKVAATQLSNCGVPDRMGPDSQHIVNRETMKPVLSNPRFMPILITIFI
jgi:hypothetical protein